MSNLELLIWLRESAEHDECPLAASYLRSAADKIDRLHEIIRSCFVVWKLGDPSVDVIVGINYNTSDEDKAAIIEICKTAPTAPGGAP